MIDVKEKIQTLIALQEKDNALDKLRLQAEAIPHKIAEMNEQVTAARLENEETKKNLIQFQLKKKEKELELETKEGQIRKFNTELNTIKSNEAYKALLNEIAFAKEEKSSLESSILELMEGIENESRAAKENDAKLKVREGEIKAEAGKLESELKSLQEQIAKLEGERAEYVKSVPEDILRHYDFVRESRQGVAIVAIEGMSCGGCHMTLRPQTVNDIIKGVDIVMCDSCSRILYKK